MLPTEVQRILLLLGLAATGYFLIIQWSRDYGQAVDAAGFSEPPTPGARAVVPDSPSDLPPDAPPAPSTAASSDVPDDALIGSGALAPAAAPVAALDAERLVKVTTPTLEVWIDRYGGDIVRAQLPKYPITGDNPDIPMVLLNQGQGRTYVAQSGLIGRDGIDKGSRPVFSATQSEYSLTENTPLDVVFTTNIDGFEVVKRFVFQPNDYLVEMHYELTNRTSKALQTALFAQIKRDAADPPGGEGMALGPQPYVGAALTTAESRYEKLSFDDIDDGSYAESVEGGWIAFLQHYFLSAWIAPPDQTHRYFGRKRADGIYTFGFVAPPVDLAPGASTNLLAHFYVGPKDQDRLEEIAPNLNLTVDYGFLWWLAVPLFKILKWFYSITGNWGIAIILLTLAVKLILYPLSAKAYVSMANMRRVAPQMKRLQERFASDRQKLSQEMMKLYQKEGVNPLGGCLPMLLPMPIFLALYWVLYESVELRQAPFLLWIDDLSIMDPLFILPLLMGASMYLQQQLSPVMGDPMQVRVMKMMPIMFTALFLFFPAGLVLYWLVNNVLSIAQQWFVMRQFDLATAKA
ncbi:MAG: membrane protein insertase YidC [Pseudomonadota bacterium]